MVAVEEGAEVDTEEEVAVEEEAGAPWFMSESVRDCTPLSLVDIETDGFEVVDDSFCLFGTDSTVAEFLLSTITVDWSFITERWW